MKIFSAATDKGIVLVAAPNRVLAYQGLWALGYGSLGAVEIA